MKLTEIDYDKLTPGAMRAMVEDEGGSEGRALVKDGTCWRWEDDGTLAPAELAAEVDRQLWLRERQQARQRWEDRSRRLAVTERGLRALGRRSADTLPQSGLSVSGQSRVIAEVWDREVARKIVSNVKPLPEIEKTYDELRQKAARPLEEQAVLELRAMETGTVERWHKEDPRWVPMHKAVVAYVVEAPETVEVRTADGNVVRVQPGERFACVSPEVSADALQTLQTTIAQMLARREVR